VELGFSVIVVQAFGIGIKRHLYPTLIMTNKLIFFSGIALCAAAFSAHADTVALYNFNNEDGSDSAAFAGVTAEDISVTTGWEIVDLYTDGANAYEGYTLGGSESELGFTSVGQSLTLTFDLTASTTLELDTISFQFKANSATTAFDTYTVSVSDGTDSFEIGVGSVSTLGSYETVSLSLDELDTLDAGDSLTFTLLFNGKSNKNSNNSFWGVDDITVTSVPEPGSFALFTGVLALGAVMLRRRAA
jgi:hypothetical protein